MTYSMASKTQMAALFLTERLMVQAGGNVSQR